MLKIEGIVYKGDVGQFRANAENIGWRKDGGGGVVVYPAGSVKRAEWFEGNLRILCQEEGADAEVFALGGIQSDQFDDVWSFFEKQCGVYVKRHRPVAALEEADFDFAMHAIEDAADAVDSAPNGSVPKRANESNLMIKAEAVRDGLELAIGGDKQALSRVFAAKGCERIGRLRLVIGTVKLEIYQSDPRWLHLLNQTATIEAVLKELGTFRPWVPEEGDADYESLVRRQMIMEIQERHGEEVDRSNTSLSTNPRTGQEDPRAGSQVVEQNSEFNAARFTAEETMRRNMSQPPPSQVFSVPTSSGADAGASAGISPVPFGQPVSSDEEAGEAGGLDRVFSEDTSKKGVANDPTDEEVSDPTKARADVAYDSNPAARRVRYVRDDSVLEGWVWKKSRFLKRWRRRYLVLLPQQLLSFKRREDASPTEFVNKGNVIRVNDADAQLQTTNSFTVVIAKRSFFMVTDDDSQRREWIQQISDTLISTK